MADFLGLMKQAAEFKSKMEAMQAELDRIEVDGAAGGGLLTVKLSGKGELRAVHIDDSLIKPDQLVQRPPPLFPTDPQWHDYSAAWNGGQMSKYMTTSAIMTAIIVAGRHRSRLAQLVFGSVSARLRRLLPQADIQKVPTS